MTPNCSQILANGQRCNAPAVNGSKFCRHHDPQRPLKPVQKSEEHEPLTLPPLNDKQCLLAALNEVLHALAEGRIKRSAADTLLSGIKFAHRLMNEIAQAGESLPALARNTRPQTIALAASTDHTKSDLFNPAPQYTGHTLHDPDPATARMVKEVLAQSHQLAQAHNRKEQRPSGL